MFYQLVGIANASFYDSLIRSSNQSSLEPTYDKTQVDIRLFNILYCTSKRKTPWGGWPGGWPGMGCAHRYFMRDKSWSLCQETPTSRAFFRVVAGFLTTKSLFTNESYLNCLVSWVTIMITTLYIYISFKSYKLDISTQKMKQTWVLTFISVLC